MMDKATLTPEVQAAMRLRPAPRPNKYAVEADEPTINPVVPMAVGTLPAPEGASIFPPLKDVPDADTAPAEDWPEPVLPGTGKTPDIPAHLLPGVFGEYAAAVAANTQTPPAMSVLFALAVLGTVLQRSFEVSPYGDSYTEPLNLWTNTAAASASRKTAVMGAWLAPLVHWEKVQRDRMRTEIARVNARRAVAEKRIEKLRQDAAKASNDKERQEITAEIEREEVEMPDPVQAPRLFTGDTTLERLQTLLARIFHRNP